MRWWRGAFVVAGALLAMPAVAVPAQGGTVRAGLSRADATAGSTAGLPPADATAASSPGPVVVLDDNGAWSWWQDERALITTDGQVLVGAVPSRSGAGGRTSQTEITRYDPASGTLSRSVVGRGLRDDDHNSPALVQTPSGRVITAWAGHGEDSLVRTAHLDPTGTSWEVGPPVAGVGGGRVTYSNLMVVRRGSGWRVYDFFRGGAGADPSWIYSDDDGETWLRGGSFIAASGRPYANYASDGRRIWLSVSRGHPYETVNDPLYAGYIEGDTVYRADGVAVGPLSGTYAPDRLSLVYQPTERNRVTWATFTDGRSYDDADAWGSDIRVTPDGSAVVAFTVRRPQPSPVPGKVFRFEYWRARWDGSRWVPRKVAEGGSELTRREVEYSGLITLDPTNPDHVYISTNVDPLTGAPLVSGADGRVHYEIFEGRTADRGATWTWTPVTSASTVDNIRPVVPAPNGGVSAVLWLRGQYPYYLDSYSMQVVAIVNRTGPTGSPGPRPRIDRGGRLVAGDFDADGRTDRYAYSPDGAAPDGWLFSPRDTGPAALVVQPHLTDGLQLASGDFDGNGTVDLLRVRTDGATAMWTWRGGGAWAARSLPKAPVGARPVVGDFDGDGRADVLWATDAAGDQLVWWGGANPGASTSTLRVSGPYRPFAGDFDGDGRADIFWFNPAGHDHVWSGAGRGRFVSAPAPAVDSSAQPIVGDFDGDRRADIVWYRKGSAPDAVWFGAGRGSFTPGAPISVSGSYQPVAGDFDGNGRAEVHWYAPGPGLDSLWGADRLRRT
ncbi:MAG: VCBS repeat-containing protein [Actinobacteria bacterium]|nr:VCBS repeat-containing protein [Actinomycetota bacterium]